MVQPQGDADPGDIPERLPVRAVGNGGIAQLRVPAADVHHADQPGDVHGDDGGPGRAGHVHAQPRHQHKIQHDVDQAGDQQEQERRVAVAHAPQDACVHVVAQVAQRAQEQDADVAHRHVPGVGGSLHQPQKQRAEANAQHRQRQGAQVQEHHGVAHHHPLPRLIAAAGGLAHQNGDAGAQPHEQAQEHLHRLAAGAHRRQGGRAAVVADDQHVHRAVKLLKNVADAQR